MQEINKINATKHIQTHRLTGELGIVIYSVKQEDLIRLSKGCLFSLVNSEKILNLGIFKNRQIHGVNVNFLDYSKECYKSEHEIMMLNWLSNEHEIKEAS